MTKKIFLDTCALVEITAGTQRGGEFLKIVRASEGVYTGGLNLYELWYLKARLASEEAADGMVASIRNLATILVPSEEDCLRAARLKKNSGARGIGAIDFLTASCAISAQASVLTCDEHFAHMVGVKSTIL